MDLPQLGTIATNFCYISNQMKERLGKDFILTEKRFNGGRTLNIYCRVVFEPAKVVKP